MTLVGALSHRIYGDFLMPSRLPEYRGLLSGALDHGYSAVTIEAFWALLSDGGLDPNRRYLVLRHDIDTDTRTARLMFEIESDLGVASSYFLRLTTFNLELIREIVDAGGHVGYHYEELATVAKERGVQTSAEAAALIPEAQDRFLENLAKLRRSSGLPLRIAASHGDFMNRRLGLSNHAVLGDRDFRQRAGIDLEAYDAALLDRMTSRHSDTLYPTYWVPSTPTLAIDRNDPVVYFLVHPRHWKVNRRVNARDDVERVLEEMRVQFTRSKRPDAGDRGDLGPRTGGRPLAAGVQTRRLRVAMALYADITFDSRVQREAEALASAGHEVTIHCLSGSPPATAPYKVVTHRPTSSGVFPDGSSPFLSTSRTSPVRRLVVRARWMIGYIRNLRAWGALVVQAAGPMDVWHVHDLTALMAVGPRVRQPTRLIYDSHEIFVETGTAARLPRTLRRLLSMYERRLGRKANTLITVNDEYARVLDRRIQPRRTLIVRNCPPRWNPADHGPSPLRAAAGLSDDQPLVLYHGSFAANRGIEQVAEALMEPGLGEVHLALLGFGGDRDAIVALVNDHRFEGRIHQLDAVPPDELLGWVAGADVDAIPLQRSSLNHWLCTPNKLWESLAAGVPVVVSDFPSMAPIVMNDPLGSLGGVCDPADPLSIADSIQAILELPSERRAALRARCLQAAHDRWNWEHEVAGLVSLYEGLAASA